MAATPLAALHRKLFDETDRPNMAAAPGISSAMRNSFVAFQHEIAAV
ncbi:hypothetical protein [Janthinobacterium sp. HLX7-2]